MSSQFLTKDNFAKIYSNIKDIIVSNEGFDIDSDKKYKKALKKMAISFHKKNPNQSDISTMNNDALNKFIPFIQSIVAKSGKQGGNIMPFDLSSDGMGSGMDISASNLDDSFNQTFSSQQSDSDKSAPSNEDFMQRLNRMENERNNVLQKDFGVDRRNNLAVAQPMSSRQISHEQNNSRTISNIEEQRKLTDDRIKSQNIHQGSNVSMNNNQLQQQQMMQQMQEKQQRQQMEELQKQRLELTKDKQQRELSNNNMTKQIEDLQRQLNQLPSTLSTFSSNNNNNNIERHEPINIIFDTGTSSNPKVNNGNKKYWINFVVPFQNPIEIKGNRTLYLDNLIIYGIDNSQNVPYFFIEIEEFKADTVTNTFKPAKGISVFNNSTNNTLINCNQNRKIINVSNLTLNQLTVNVHTNIEDKESIFETSNMINRIIMEFKVI